MVIKGANALKKWIIRKLPLILLLSLLVNAAYTTNLYKQFYKQSRVYSTTYDDVHGFLVHAATTFSAISPDQIDAERKDGESAYNSSLGVLSMGSGYMRAMWHLAEATRLYPSAVPRLQGEIFNILRGYIIHMPDEFEYYTARLNSLVKAGEEARRPDRSYDLEKLWREHWERLLDLGLRY